MTNYLKKLTKTDNKTYIACVRRTVTQLQTIDVEIISDAFDIDTPKENYFIYGVQLAPVVILYGASSTINRPKINSYVVVIQTDNGIWWVSAYGEREKYTITANDIIINFAQNTVIENTNIIKFKNEFKMGVYQSDNDEVEFTAEGILIEVKDTIQHSYIELVNDIELNSLQNKITIAHSIYSDNTNVDAIYSDIYHVKVYSYDTEMINLYVSDSPRLEWLYIPYLLWFYDNGYSHTATTLINKDLLLKNETVQLYLNSSDYNSNTINRIYEDIMYSADYSTYNYIVEQTSTQYAESLILNATNRLSDVATFIAFANSDDNINSYMALLKNKIDENVAGMISVIRNIYLTSSTRTATLLPIVTQQLQRQKFIFITQNGQSENEYIMQNDISDNATYGDFYDIWKIDYSNEIDTIDNIIQYYYQQGITPNTKFTIIDDINILILMYIDLLQRISNERTSNNSSAHDNITLNYGNIMDNFIDKLQNYTVLINNPTIPVTDTVSVISGYYNSAKLLSKNLLFNIN